MKRSSTSHAWLLAVTVGALTGIDGGPFTLAIGPESFESPAAIAEEKPHAAAGEIQERAIPVPEPPEALAERAQIEQTARTIQQGRQTPTQLRQMLVAHPDPGIRVKATQAVAGKPLAGQTGGGEPPESKIERQDAQNALSQIQQGRLTSTQLHQLLLVHPDPGIRSKALKAQGVQPQRSGRLHFMEPASLLSFLWDLVNPFAATHAIAQAPVSIRLTPQNPYVPPPSGSNYQGAYMNLYNASVLTTPPGLTNYQVSPPVLLMKNLPVPTPSTPTTVMPPHQIKVTLNYPGPPGWYIIDFHGVGGVNAKLYRFNFYGQNYHLLQTWAGGPGSQHYITVENFSQGPTETLFFSIGQASFTSAEVLIQQF